MASNIPEDLVLKRESGFTFATIKYDKEKKWLFIDWEGFLTVDLVKKGSEELLKTFQSVENITKILVNNQKVSGPWNKANDWFVSDWNPRAIEAGLKYMAVIVSADIFTQLSLKGFIETNPGYLVHSFEEVSAAEDWLAKQ